MTWDYHLDHIRSEMSCGNYMLARAKHEFPTKIRLLLYNSLVRSHLEYGILTWGRVKVSKLAKLIIIQKSIRNVAGKSFRCHTDPLFSCHSTLKVTDLIRYNACIFTHKYLYNLLPESFHNMFTPSREPNRTTNFKVSKSKSCFLDQFPKAFLPNVWTKENVLFRSTGSHRKFKSSLSRSFIDQLLSNY